MKHSKSAACLAMISAIIFLTANLGMATVANLGMATENDIRIQKVINKTRNDLGELAKSTISNEIADLMKTLDEQYSSWSKTCGKDFDPANAEGTCKVMADQMRETGIKLYRKLGKYLPSIQDRYQKSAKSAHQILNEESAIEPLNLYKETLNSYIPPKKGTNGTKLRPAEKGEPFRRTSQSISNLNMPGNLLNKLKKILPSFGAKAPTAIVAGASYVTMHENAITARDLALAFDEAAELLEQQKEYGTIVLAVTKGVEALPGMFGIQASQSAFTAEPDQNVLDYYEQQEQYPDEGGIQTPQTGGLPEIE
ncbi:MAG: hypothetical protein KJ550_03750 [Proteobacteria bacterium]|nr:hypothetical protein [Desulfobacteraceae bacterium]MBU4012560.1 hypothetical protein [Pseudomonadota bacterium]MBU4068322.1 hypothetical protein [Pseudomonadota bacterium]MBU4099979.1 hypothetical protein [Pseudomonadota bacterium]